jgi:hypothetical protein
MLNETSLSVNREVLMHQHGSRDEDSSLRRYEVMIEFSNADASTNEQSRASLALGFSLPRPYAGSP